jgi:ankyrin repeat protein
MNCIGAVPLHYVCLRKSNHRGIANILLENGAFINASTMAGKTALHFACENSLPELVEVLGIFGADPNLVENEGNSPMHCTLMKEGGRDTVKKQILEHLLYFGANVQVVNLQGLSPVHVACRNGFVRCAQLLVERAANLAALTPRSETPMHLACLGNHADVTQWLIGTLPLTVDAQDCEGNTPLHVCAAGGYLDSAVLLLRAGANTTLKNHQKKTALELSRVRGTDLNNTHNPELVQVLKDATKSGNCHQS